MPPKVCLSAGSVVLGMNFEWVENTLLLGMEIYTKWKSKKIKRFRKYS